MVALDDLFKMCYYLNMRIYLYAGVEPLTNDRNDEFWKQFKWLWQLCYESAEVASGLAPTEEIAQERATEAAERFQQDYPRSDYNIIFGWT